MACDSAYVGLLPRGRPTPTPGLRPSADLVSCALQPRVAVAVVCRLAQAGASRTASDSCSQSPGRWLLWPWPQPAGPQARSRLGFSQGPPRGPARSTSSSSRATCSRYRQNAVVSFGMSAPPPPGPGRRPLPPSRAAGLPVLPVLPRGVAELGRDLGAGILQASSARGVPT